MMEPADLESSTRHDQLPSADEYKADVGYRKSGSNRHLGVGSNHSRRPDPTGVDSLSLVSNSAPDEDDDEFGIPSSSKYGQSPPRLQNWKYLLCALTTLLVVITSSVAIAKSNNKKESSGTSWIKDSQRYQEIVNYMTRNDVSKTNTFYDTKSPQYLAAQWLAHGDGARLSIPTNPSSAHANQFVGRYALAVVYYSLGGPDWTYQLNFLSAEHVCTWYQDFDVINDEFNLFSGDFVSLGIHGCKRVGEDLVPFSIYLPNNNLVGSIPTEVHVFDHMEVISLQFNSGVTGKIPEGLSNMEKLRHLALQWCDLTGTIPSWIGKATDLHYLGLGNNRLEGSIPSEIGSLTNLQLLGLDDNDLEANIELFHPLANLKSLYLEDNRISGTISEALMASWPLIQELDVSSNDLHGALPDGFFNHKNDLRVVDLHGNSFEGGFPAVSRDNNNLEFLALQDNKFTGIIPHSIIKLKTLRHLDLNMNDFSSTLPEVMAQMTNLEYLFVGGNSFEGGEFPRFLYELTNLRELSLKASNLSGPIPESIHSLSNMDFLDLHFNDLTGSIPSEVGLMTNLKYLLLKNNKLTGTVPAEMKNLSNLEIVLLEQNNFVGNAKAICDGAEELVHFASDCRSGIQCSCCHVCCDDGDQTCNAGEWDGGFDPIWEYGYRRNRYSFDMGPHVVVLP